QYQGRLAAASDCDSVFSVVVSATEASTLADGCSKAGQLVHTVRAHEACIKLMSKESAIRICTGGRSGTTVSDNTLNG
ncbi:hypothetical protein GGI08_008502, partial [Coemansia sp. S2]